MAEPEVGVRFGPVTLVVDDRVVRLYAQAADDYNPIHFDDNAAHRLQLPARIAHGMISGALLSRVLTEAFGAQWLRGGQLRLKFVSPVVVGQTVTAYAVVRAHDPVTLDLTAQTAPECPVIAGTAMLVPPGGLAADPAGAADG